MQVKDGQQCRYCGGQHERDKKKCPAFGKTCRRCGKFNHFQSVCQQKHTVHQVQEESSTDDETVYCIETVGAVEHKRGKRTFLYRFVSMMTVGKQKFRVNWMQEPLVMSSHSTSCVKLSKLENLLCNQQQQNEGSMTKVWFKYWENVTCSVSSRVSCIH